MGNSRLAPRSIPNSREAIENILSKLLEEDIQLFTHPGHDPLPPIPWGGGTPTEKDALKAIHSGKVYLPLAYLEAYVQPLLDNLPTFLARCPDRFYEPLLGAIYDHANVSLQYPLWQFSAVLSNFYRSFLNARRRVNVDFPSVAQLPPLAVFRSQEFELGIFTGEFGPFSIPVNQIRSLFGGKVGVIVLPYTYAFHPLLWTSLAHEVSGHDMLHADKELLPEIERKVEECFHSGPGKHLLNSPSVKPGQKELIVQLWTYWIEEAAADVLAVLNVGPSFGFSLAFYMGLLSQHMAQLFEFSPPSLIRFFSGMPLETNPAAFHHGQNPNRHDLDPHPVDILRLYTTIGATQSLSALAPNQVKTYVRQLEALAETCAQGGGKTVSVHGWIPVEGDRWERKDEELDFGIMRETALLVGQLLGTMRLETFNNHSFQDLETWDEYDESTAQSIRTMLTHHHRSGVRDMGDDAQLLAGAALAFLDKPEWYRNISDRLGNALAKSFERDAYWGLLGAHPMVSWSPDPKNKKLVAVVQEKKLAEFSQTKSVSKKSSSKKKPKKLKVQKLTDDKKKKASSNR